MDGILNLGKNDNRIASLIAFFLSKYDRRAAAYLGFASFSAAFSELGAVVKAKPNYIKLRRDEFDALFPNNPRQGWNKRNPTPAVIRFFTEFDAYSFEELGTRIKMLIEFCKANEPIVSVEMQRELSAHSEKEIEDIMNFKDEGAALRTVNTTVKQRLLNYKIVPELKQYYNYRCQICGQRHYDAKPAFDSAHGRALASEPDVSLGNRYILAQFLSVVCCNLCHHCGKLLFCRFTAVFHEATTRCRSSQESREAPPRGSFRSVH